MSHPTLSAIRQQIRTMDEEVTLISHRIARGEREEDLVKALRNNLRRAKQIKGDVERYLKEGWAGAEEWMITTLTLIITVCEVALSEFRRVPNSFERAYQS